MIKQLTLLGLCAIIIGLTAGCDLFTGGTSVVIPLQVTNLNANTEETYIILSWDKPTNSLFNRVILCKSSTKSPTNSDEGERIYTGTNTSYTDTRVEKGNTYYYSIFSEYTNGLKSYPSSLTTDAVDRIPPLQIDSLSITEQENTLTVSWALPNDSDLVGVIIRQSHIKAPQTIDDGELVYTGSETSVTSIPLTTGIPYYFSAFTFDDIPNYSNPISETATKTEANSFMIWLERDANTADLYKSDLLGLEKTKIDFNQQAYHPYDITIDEENAALFWSDPIHRHIGKSSLSGLETDIILTDLTSPKGLVYYNNHLYWADNNTIYKADSDGTNKAALVTDTESTPQCIAIDPNSESLFWSDTTDHTIKKAPLSGHPVTTVFTLTDHEIKDMIIVSSNLYWINTTDHTIYKGDPTTSSKTPLLTLTNPSGLDYSVHNDHLYISDKTDTGQLVYCTLEGTITNTITHSNIITPTRLACLKNDRIILAIDDDYMAISSIQANTYSRIILDMGLWPISMQFDHTQNRLFVATYPRVGQKAFIPNWGKGLFILSLDDSSITPLSIPNAQTIKFCYNIVTNTLYFINDDNHFIYNYDLESQTETLILSNTEAYDLAIDYHTTKLYYSDETTKTIWHANWSGKNTLPLLQNPKSPHNLYMDNNSKKLYFIDSDFIVKNYDFSTKSTTTLLTIGYFTPRFCVDPTLERLYWSKQDETLGNTINQAFLSAESGTVLYNITKTPYDIILGH